MNLKLPSLLGLKLEVHRDCTSTIKLIRKAAIMTALCKTFQNSFLYDKNDI